MRSKPGLLVLLISLLIIGTSFFLMKSDGQDSGYITVKTPRSSQFDAGSKIWISWETDSTMMNLDLVKGTINVLTITSNFPCEVDETTTYEWTIPEDLVEGDDYMIRYWTSGGLSEYSENFEIIAVTDMSGYTAGGQQTIGHGGIVGYDWEVVANTIVEYGIEILTDGSYKMTVLVMDHGNYLEFVEGNDYEAIQIDKAHESNGTWIVPKDGYWHIVMYNDSPYSFDLRWYIDVTGKLDPLDDDDPVEPVVEDSEEDSPGFGIMMILGSLLILGISGIISRKTITP